MPRRLPPADPKWDLLYETASTQDGYFTTAQAAAAGYSPQLLHHHLTNGRIRRVHRGIYRLVHFPPGENEDLAVVWLWSEQQGVFTHETALALHGLSDALPARLYVTLPLAWRRRRLRFPRGVFAYYADLRLADRTWHGSVPITSPARTVLDCARARVAPDLVQQAITQGISRGLFAAKTVARAARYVRSLQHPDEAV